MDRTGAMTKKILFLLGIFAAAVAVSAAMPGAEAGTIMAPPQSEPVMKPGESYPDSRFGSAPAKVDLGTRSGFAARETEELDAAEKESGASRSPAGLEFSSDPKRRDTKKSDPSYVRVAPTALGGDLPDPVRPAADSLEPASVAARKGVQEVALIAGDLGYFPKTVFVSRDVPVRMYVTGASKNTLCIMMDSFQVRKQVRSQRVEEITFTPNVPGKYRFYCPVNGMEGTMIVKDLAFVLQPPDGDFEARRPASSQEGN